MLFLSLIDACKTGSVMDNLRFWLVDAFTDTPYQGNPAGVCVVDEFLSEERMQEIAAELNWSETSFIKPLGENRYHIRWFSPKDEAPICGHATLAGAHILWTQGFVQGDDIHFESCAGPLSVSRHGLHMTMKFPNMPVRYIQTPDLMLEALGDVEIESVHRDSLIYIVILKSPEQVIHLAPNLSMIETFDCRAVTVTARGYYPYDFVSRYFAPRVGIPEDPVCGSAHCRLFPFWGNILGKDKLLAHQVSKRGGIIHGTFDHEYVYLSSRAVTVCEGFLHMNHPHVELQKKAA